MLQAALNGRRDREEHPRVPLTAHELAVAAAAAVAAGADVIHLHARDAEGRESIVAEDVAAAVEAIRGACPGIPVGVTTGAWIVADPAGRLRLIDSWTSLPDFASVNFHEPGAEDLAQLLLERGVDVEAGLGSPGATRTFADTAVAARCFRVLLEPPQADVAAALAVAASMDALLESAGLALPAVLHGFDEAAWPVLRAAVDAGRDTRIGLEDVLVLPDGSPAVDNAALVQAARQIIAAVDGV